MAKKKSPGAGGQPGKGSEKRARKSAPDKRRKTSGRGTGMHKFAAPDAKRDTSGSPAARAKRDHKRSGLNSADMKQLCREVTPPAVSKELFKRSNFGNSKQSSSIPESYIIPYWNPDGTMRDFFRVRLLETYYGWDGKLCKYMCRQGRAPEFYLSPLLAKPTWREVIDDPSIEVWITEGEKKGDAACKLNIPCIAIGGVWCWRRKSKDENTGEMVSVPIDDFGLIAWQGRTVKIAFDSDLDQKGQVRAALYALAAELRERGARPYAITLPSEGGSA